MITKDRSESLLDKDWGAKIPDYITKGTFSVAVFFLSLFMRGNRTGDVNPYQNKILVWASYYKD